jgi:hypothetical protein
MILTKTGQQHGKSTGNHSKFYSLIKVNVMNFFFTPLTKTNLQDEPDKHTLIQIHNHEQNTIEGSEFLDDAIRMHDQPLKNTEENIANELGDSL